MSLKTRLEKEFDFLKEKYKNMFLLFLAIATGEASMIYAVVSGEKPIYVLILAFFGAIILIAIMIKLFLIDKDIQRNLSQLEDLEN